MSQDTVTVEGVQFDVDELDMSVEAFKDAGIERGSRGSASGGRYLIVDDGDSFDDAVYIVDFGEPKLVTNGHGNPIFFFKDFEEAIEEQDPLEEYISDSDWFYSAMDELVDSEEDDDASVKFGVSVVSDDQADGIMNDDGVAVQAIEVEDGRPVVIFSDER